MAKETERKFLVKDDSYKKPGKGEYLQQGFLSTDKERVVRVRIKGDKAWLTIKGSSQGATRTEYEYEIPKEDAEYLMEHLCIKPTIEKHRYLVEHAGFTWEVDEFHGENEGLVLAEIELPGEDTPFDLPAWVGEEVTGDARYFNSNLAVRPFSGWQILQ
jgi:adenylate cyclase